MNRTHWNCRIVAAAVLGVLSVGAKSVHDVSLFVQLDMRMLATECLPQRLAEVRASGADGVQIALVEFFREGENRARTLAALGRAIACFETNGYPVAVWTTSLGYGESGGADFERRFPQRRKLKAFDGRERARCPTDLACRAAILDNARDFLRAGAKFILWDDDLVQSCRPGLGCVCDEHLARVGRKLGRPVTAAEVAASFTGAPNALRTAFLDTVGEAGEEYCRALRAAADEVNPGAGMGICASWTHYDADGSDFTHIARILAGPGRKPFIRASGAPYWTIRGARHHGQKIGSVVEFVRWQIARYRGTDVTLLDENDPHPRRDREVPALLCELYDKGMIAEGGIVRNKYMLRDSGNGAIDPAYLAAHHANRAADVALGAVFRDATPLGFRIVHPEHTMRATTYPPKPISVYLAMRLSALPTAGIYLSLNGAPTHYDATLPGPCAAFGAETMALTDDDFRHGVVTDAEGARLLAARGVDTGTADGRVWRMYANAAGGKFAVLNRAVWDIDLSPEGVVKMPVAEIWRFFTGGALPALNAGAPNAYMLAKRGRDGRSVALVENLFPKPSGPFTVTLDGVTHTLALPGYGFALVTPAP